MSLVERSQVQPVPLSQPLPSEGWRDTALSTQAEVSCCSIQQTEQVCSSAERAELDGCDMCMGESKPLAELTV